MLKYFFLSSLLIIISCQQTDMAETSIHPKFVLVIHGGAGTITKENMTPNKEAEYRQILTYVLKKGKEELAQGSQAVDVVEKLNKIMEDSHLFNAGKGSVFNSNEKQDMDASIMNGIDLSCGSVAGVSNVKNPISAARMVMDSSEHVMLSRSGAEEFAREMGLEIMDSSYFFDQRRHDSWKKIHEDAASELSENEKHGTVGVVCLDSHGNLAAGTTTGGMTYKKWGRIGDSPIIGAGTYADNNSCAVSCTGHGEYFIRATIARDISALVELKGYSPEEAANSVIHGKLTDMGGTGGVIVVDKNGNYAMTFNTEGMYRGVVSSESDPEVFIYK